MAQKRRNPLLFVIIVTPIVIAPLVLAGAYMGFYVGDEIGSSRTVLAIAFSTAGFLASIFILVRVIKWAVARDGKATG